MLLNLFKRHFQAFKTHTQGTRPAAFNAARHFRASSQLNVAFSRSANCGPVPGPILTSVLERRRGGWASTNGPASESLRNRALRGAVGGRSRDLNLLYLASFSISRLPSLFYLFIYFPFRRHQTKGGK